MKTKTINAVINKKFDQWVATITDENVRKLVKKNSILTGGSIASMLLKEQVNDFDFYFRNKETVLAVANYYVEQFKQNPPPTFKKTNDEVKIWVDQPDEYRVRILIKSAGIASASESSENSYQYFEQIPDNEGAAVEYVENAANVLKETTDEKPTFRPVFLSSNAISLSDQVQLVIRFYGDPEHIHENYDYVHATNYWTSWDRKVTLRTEALECLLTKELRYIGSKYPICSIVRMRKFLGRQWTINAGQILKMAMQVNELDLTNYDVLEEQLMGMDVAYFMDVIQRLKEKDPTKIDYAYLVEIIDRIF